MNEGVGFVKVTHSNYIIVKTFIPWEMLKEDQEHEVREFGRYAITNGFDTKPPESVFRYLEDSVEE